MEGFERIYYRDQLRNSRYAALADAEGFLNICFALEALGKRVTTKKRATGLGSYEDDLRDLAQHSITLSDLNAALPQYFSSFSALFLLVRLARNDAMHTGVYARHITMAAISLCIGLEEALMCQNKDPIKVSDLMVKSPVTVEEWQPIALARQLMLTHSFSFLPVFMDKKWMLISETALAVYIRRKNDLKKKISDAVEDGLLIVQAEVISSNEPIDDLVNRIDKHHSINLWLVENENNPPSLCGVLSPYELMSY